MQNPCNQYPSFPAARPCKDSDWAKITLHSRPLFFTEILHEIEASMRFGKVIPGPCIRLHCGRGCSGDAGALLKTPGVPPRSSQGVQTILTKT